MVQCTFHNFVIASFTVAKRELTKRVRSSLPQQPLRTVPYLFWKDSDVYICKLRTKDKDLGLIVFRH